MTEPAKRISLDDIKEVWFQAPSTVLDAIHPITGKPLWGKTDPTGQPGVERMTFDDALARQHEHWRSDPVEITYDEFQEALNVLPPEDWNTWTMTESFKMSERTSGAITAIYVRIGSEPDQARYYCFSDSFTMKHTAIVRLVLEKTGA